MPDTMQRKNEFNKFKLRCHLTRNSVLHTIFAPDQILHLNCLRILWNLFLLNSVNLVTNQSPRLDKMFLNLAYNGYLDQQKGIHPQKGFCGASAVVCP